MKKRYQIDQQRAVQQFRRLAVEQNPNIQMILPMADIVGLLQEGVGNLLRHAGLELMHLVMDEEVKSLAGERHQQHEQRRAHRWGKEEGYCVVDGQKVPIKRTRLRSGDNREQRLGSYELFQRDGPLQQGVWDKMMRGLSTRNYGAVVKDFQSAYRRQPGPTLGWQRMNDLFPDGRLLVTYFFAEAQPTPNREFGKVTTGYAVIQELWVKKRNQAKCNSSKNA